MSLCRGQQQHGRLRDTLMRSPGLSRWILKREPAQPEMPHSREDFVVTFLHWSLFFSCWNSSPDTEVRSAQKNFGFLLLCASCIWNSNELVCSKMVRNRMNCYKCRKLQSSQPEDATGSKNYRCYLRQKTCMVFLDLHNWYSIRVPSKSIIRQFDSDVNQRLVVRFAVFCYIIDTAFVEPKISIYAVNTFFKKTGEDYCDARSQYKWIYWTLLRFCA